MDNISFEQAMINLRKQFGYYDWTYRTLENNPEEKYFRWPGKENEDIIVTVKGCSDELQLFHHHEYFYFIYVVDGEIDMRSSRFYNKVTLKKNHIYAGQPFAGHAAVPSDNKDTALLCILIKPEIMFRHFLPSLSLSSEMLNFLVKPASDSFSQEIIHFDSGNDKMIRSLIEMIAIEYASAKADTQAVLKPLVLTYLMQISRYYNGTSMHRKNRNTMTVIMNYIREHMDTVSLNDLADEFSYHPNYLSAMLKKETGKNFSKILLEERMERALVLLQGTNLPVEQVAYILGYSNPSNFHKAFREYYNKSPREYLKK